MLAILNGFQYNTCFGSTSNVIVMKNHIDAFQYNTCFGSTNCMIYKEKYLKKFQYNTCFGSTNNAFDYFITIPYFNTTLVSVRLTPFANRPALLLNFNTTLVSVRLHHTHGKSRRRVISIQHLFRFDRSGSNTDRGYIQISIQHLFRFDEFFTTAPIRFCQISIQHLFRFDLDDIDTKLKDMIFQYNTCFGSTTFLSLSLNLQSNFNTTLVSVRLSDLLFGKYLSIYFNTTLVSVRQIFSSLDS